MSDDEAPIDPRYDPAFQRGFSGEVRTGSHGQFALRRTAAVNPSPAWQAPKRAEELRVGPPPVDGSPVSSGGAAQLGAASAAGPLAPAPDAFPAGAPATGVSAGPRELARNPFVIGLGVLAAVLILVGGGWAYEGFATIITNGGTRNEVEFWAAQTMSFGAPLAVVAGLAVVALLLVLFGRSWRKL